LRSRASRASRGSSRRRPDPDRRRPFSACALSRLELFPRVDGDDLFCDRRVAALMAPEHALESVGAMRLRPLERQVDDGVIGWIADDVLRILPLLHRFELAKEHLAVERNPAIRRSEPFTRSICDR